MENPDPLMRQTLEAHGYTIVPFPDAETQGWEAFWQGVPIEACPCESPEAKAQWRHGWIAGSIHKFKMGANP